MRIAVTYRAGAHRMAGWMSVLSGAVALLAGAVAMAAESPESLVQKLVAGGYNIFLRHTWTGEGTDQVYYTTDPVKLADCSLQRRLDERGRNDARAIGAVFRSRGIPVAEVLSSPYCRTLATARLAFGDDLPKADTGLSTICEAPGDVFAAHSDYLRRMLSTPPVAGNRVLVSHNCNIRALWRWLPAKCASEPEMGDAVVVKPAAGEAGFELVGCLPIATIRAWARGH